MGGLRHHIFAHRGLAGLVLAAALLMKLLVPAGFMPDVSAGSFRIAVCPGFVAGPMASAMPGMTHHQADGRGHATMESPCPYAALTAPALSAVDPIQLALALAFIVATVATILARVRVLPRDHIRPPLRAPPTDLILASHR
uniref:hypothetical protein n=1 Tax=uncultured Sphingomonas sp. TaxID=158754 RepID=UPI0035CABF83